MSSRRSNNKRHPKKFTFTEKMESIKATIETNQGQRKHEACEDKLENSELRFQMEKVQKEKALLRCKEFEMYVKQLEAEIRNSYCTEDTLLLKIDTMTKKQRSHAKDKKAVKDDLVQTNRYIEVLKHKFITERDGYNDEKKSLTTAISGMKKKYEADLRTFDERNKFMEYEVLNKDRIISNLSSQHEKDKAKITQLEKKLKAARQMHEKQVNGLLKQKRREDRQAYEREKKHLEIRISELDVSIANLKVNERLDTILEEDSFLLNNTLDTIREDFDNDEDEEINDFERNISNLQIEE